MTARVLALVVLAAASLQAQVTFDRILHPENEPQNWLSYSGSLFNQRFSPLTQITTVNAKNLELQWIWQAKSLEKYEATSIVVDGVLYTVQAPNDVVALDAVTGRPYWTFTYENLPDARNCLGNCSIIGPTINEKIASTSVLMLGMYGPKSLVPNGTHIFCTTLPPQSSKVFWNPPTCS